MRTRGQSEDDGRGPDTGKSPTARNDEHHGEIGADEKGHDSDIPAGTSHNSEKRGRSRGESIDCSSDTSDSKKKKKRVREGLFEGNEVPGDTGIQNEDFRLFETCFPKEFEPDFSTAVFELGLKHSSPKILMSLMPMYTNLHSEHLKSHLQKYRIHHERSKDEFLAFYNEFMKDDFAAWEDTKGWETKSSKKSSDFLSLDTPACNTVPLLEITDAANSIQNADNLNCITMGSSAFSRSCPQVSSPTAAGGPKKPKNLAGYKNIVTQASQLYAEWRVLYEESLHDTSKIGSDNFGPSDFDYQVKYAKMMKSGRQTMGLSSNYKDEPGAWLGGDGNISSMTSDAMHHSYMMGAHLAANPHLAGLNSDMYYGSGASLPLLPLHSNPYGGYSNNYTHPSSYLSSSQLASQHHHLSSTNMNTNSPHSLNALSNIKPIHLNNISNYHIPTIDNFAPLSLSSGQYITGVPLLARSTSVDGSEDNTDNSSNGSNSAGDTMTNSNLCGAQSSNVNPYFFSSKEVVRGSEAVRT